MRRSLVDYVICLVRALSNRHVFLYMYIRSGVSLYESTKYGIYSVHSAYIIAFAGGSCPITGIYTCCMYIYSVQRGLLHAVCSKVDDIRALTSMNYEE